MTAVKNISQFTFFVKSDMALIFIIMSPAAANMLKHLS